MLHVLSGGKEILPDVSRRKGSVWGVGCAGQKAK